MKKYLVIIEELISDEFEIEADSKEEAISKSIEEYYNCNFIVGPNVTIQTNRRS